MKAGVVSRQLPSREEAFISSHHNQAPPPSPRVPPSPRSPRKSALPAHHFTDAMNIEPGKTAAEDLLLKTDSGSKQDHQGKSKQAETRRVKDKSRWKNLKTGTCTFRHECYPQRLVHELCAA